MRELSGTVYAEARPGPLQQALRWLRDRVLEVLPDDVDGGPVVDALVVAALLVLALVALRVGAQVVRHRRGGAPADEDVFAGDGRRSAEDHRSRADALARAEDWTGAVAERFRAVVRAAEERLLLDERPGRTATEAAADLGAALPAVAAELAAGARVFDDVVYGSSPGSADDDERIRRLDRRVAAERPAAPVAGSVGAVP